MEKSNNFVWFGILTFLSGLFQIVGWIVSAIFQREFDSSGYFFGSLIDQLGTIFFIFTLFAIFWYHATSEGWFNKACLFIGIVGTTFLIGNNWVGTWVVPYIHEKAPKLLETDPGYPLSIGMNLSYLLFALALILIAILIIKAKKLPILVAIGFILAPILDILPIGMPIGELIFSLSLIYLSIKFCKEAQTQSNS